MAGHRSSVCSVTLTLRSPIHDPERILAFGGPGAGKTTNVISIARRIPDATFRVIDTDGAFGRMLSGDNAPLDSRNGGNIVVEKALEWVDYTNLLDRFRGESAPDDWIVVDMISPAWDAVQEFYTEQIFGREIDRFFMEARKANAKGSAFDGRRDWGVINRLYNKWANLLTIKQNCHVYATASASILGEDDAKELKELFGRYNIRPVGQKFNAHRFHSCLWMKRNGRGDFISNTIKDRERPEMVDAVIGDFAIDYLVNTAGWKRAAA